MKSHYSTSLKHAPKRWIRIIKDPTLQESGSNFLDCWEKYVLFVSEAYAQNLMAAPNRPDGFVDKASSYKPRILTLWRLPRSSTARPNAHRIVHQTLILLEVAL